MIVFLCGFGAGALSVIGLLVWMLLQEVAEEYERLTARAK